MVLRFPSCSPRGGGLSCPRCRRRISADVAPGSRRQDHTTSPYAAAFSPGVSCLSVILIGKPVSHFSGITLPHLTPQRPSHPYPTYRDDRETSLSGHWTARLIP